MKAPFRRRLDDSHDKKAFFIAFLGGLIGIFFFRIVGGTAGGVTAWDWAAILFAITVLLLYGVYIYSTKNRSGISVDRASDNIYYLGLLFTLASLAYSLILLSKGIDTKKTTGNAVLVLSLLPDFGLALFSTIAGIFGRIVLQQLRNDPMDVETEAREELGVAIRQLRETIGQVVTNLNGLSDQTSLTLSELNQTVSQTLEQSANQNTMVIRAVAEEVGTLSTQLQEQVTNVTNFTAASTNQFNEILSGLRTQFERFGEIPDSLGTKFGELSSKLSNATELIESSTEHQTRLSSEMLASVSALKTAFSEAGLSRISGIVEDAEIKFSEISENLTDNQTRLSVTLDGINTQVDVLNTTSSSLASYEKRIEASARSVDEANTEYIEELSKAAETLRSKTDLT